MNMRATSHGWHTGAEPPQSVLLTGRSYESTRRRTASVPAARPRMKSLRFARRLESAGRQIALLANAAGDQAAQILEFQVAFLDDEDFLDPIFAAIPAGARRTRLGRPPSTSRSQTTIPRPTNICKRASSDLADLRDRVLRILRGGAIAAPKVPGGAVICAEDLPPSGFLEIDWSSGGGVALLRGSPTSHVALLARSRGIPMVVQLGVGSRNCATRRCLTANARHWNSIRSRSRSTFSRDGERRIARAARRRTRFCAGRRLMGGREDTALD